MRLRRARDIKAKNDQEQPRCRISVLLSSVGTTGSTDQPTNAQCRSNGGVGAILDEVADGVLEGNGRVLGLTVQLLCRALGLPVHTFSLGFCVTHKLACIFFDLAG